MPARAGGGQWRAKVAELRAGSAGSTPWVLARDIELAADLAPGGAPREARVAPGSIALLGATLRWSEAAWQAAPRAGA
ncbi:hypothetical protein CLD22_24165, partial [Rubrivivax gelatinosus]|nr:hypothetical protein [Rubrivivax gelatinosus]